MIKNINYLLFILSNCLNSHANENFFKLINPINDDNSINVFIEISAGDTFKYQLSKKPQN